MLAPGKDQIDQLEARENEILGDIGCYEMLSEQEKLSQPCPYEAAVELYHRLSEYYQHLADSRTIDHQLVLKYKSWAAHYSGENEKYMEKLERDRLKRTRTNQ